MHRINKYVTGRYMNQIRNDTLTQEDRDKIGYSLMTICSELEKLCFLYVVFCVLGRGKEFILCVMVLIGTRRYIGGFHAKTFFGCFMFSFICIFLAIWISEKAYISNLLPKVVCMISLFLVLLLAPLQSENRPVFTGKQRKQMKIKCVVSILFSMLMGTVTKTVELITVLLIIQQMETVLCFLLKRKGVKK